MIEFGPILTIAVRATALLLALYHAKHIVEEYYVHHDSRALRDLILAAMVLFAVTSMFLYGFVILEEDFRRVARAGGIVMSGAVLVGLAAIAISHWQEDRR